MQDITTLSRDVEHANNALSPIFNKEKEQKRLKQAQLIGEIGAQVMDIVRTEGELKAQKAAEAKGDAKVKRPQDGDSVALWEAYKKALTESPTYKAEMQKYGTGSDFQRAAQAATAAIQALAGGDIQKAIASGAAPYLAQLVKDVTIPKDESKITASDIAANAMAHAVVGAVVAQLSGQDAAAGAIGASSGELAARAIMAKVYPGKTTNDLTEEEKQSVSALSTLASGLVSGLASNSTASAASGAQSGRNAVENNYLSNQQRSERDKESDACKGNVSCQLQVGAKWDAISLGQDAAYAAGMLVGVPQGLYDSVESLSKSISDPAAAYDAIKQLIAGDDIFSTMSDAVKQSYIDRINLMEAEYQKAGAGGAYKAGVEAGKLVSDLAGAIAGGAGVAKAGTALTERVVAKVIGKAENAVSHSVVPFPNKVIGEYSAIKPGPLDNDLAATFSGGRYKEMVLQEDTVLYRGGVSEKPYGQFFSSEAPQGVLQTRIDKAVLPKWPGGGTSPIDTSFAIKIPSGTKVYVGEVGTQNGLYVGGTQQIVVVKPWEVKGAEIIERKPLK